MKLANRPIVFQPTSEHQYAYSLYVYKKKEGVSNENAGFKFNIEYLAIETKTQENP